ncbi:hypothetical protein WJX74_008334 [Apatococcus lobatus]|uniref:ELMO domain-containing protein n=1 Tax=Apatococcus lobatus TaxID=904363 RepID=A0AAW1QND8_9CHLO
MRKRRRGEHSSPDLQQPLLHTEGAHEPLQSAEGRQPSRSNALVPHSINKMDWEDLWQTVIANCSEGFQCIWSTIRRCLCRWMPPISHPQPIHLTQLQEERLEALRKRAQEPYDGEKQEHQDALRALPTPAATFEGAAALPFTISSGWLPTGRLCSTDCCTSLWAPAASGSTHLQRRAVNVTFMLMDITGLRNTSFDAPITSPAGLGLCTLLAESTTAFEEVYCLAFAVLEREWLAMKASYMDFPAVLSRTRKQLDSALTASPCSALDLQHLLHVQDSEL